MQELGRVIERGLAADGRLVRFEVVVSDRPGGIASLTKLLADVRLPTDSTQVEIYSALCLTHSVRASVCLRAGWVFDQRHIPRARMGRHGHRFCASEMHR